MPEAVIIVTDVLESYFQPLASKPRIVDIHVGVVVVAIVPVQLTLQDVSLEHEMNWARAINMI